MLVEKRRAGAGLKSAFFSGGNAVQLLRECAPHHDLLAFVLCAPLQLETADTRMVLSRVENNRGVARTRCARNVLRNHGRCQDTLPVSSSSSRDRVRERFVPS